MEQRQMKTVRERCHCDTSLEEFKRELDRRVASLVAAGLVEGAIRVDLDEYDDDTVRYLYLVGKRLETEEEARVRLDTEGRRSARKEEAERAEYARLKAKFEPGEPSA